MTDGRARLALDLIEYDKKYEAAMQLAFGQIFICDDQETARRISSKKFGFVCVTRVGDRYEPSGVLHGGAQD